MTDPADRLAEAARHLQRTRDNIGTADYEIARADLWDALAAYDADAERRQAERAIIDAAKRYAECHWDEGLLEELLIAVRRRRELDQ